MADTGATKTILSDRVYQQMDPSNRPMLSGSTMLQGAWGTPIKVRGKGRFFITMGSVVMERKLVVADVTDDVILGCDVLFNGEKGHTDTWLSKNVILLNGVRIPCMSTGEVGELRKVVVTKDTCVPGKSEALVDVYIERSEADDQDTFRDYVV
ncbi:hypothetical protein DPMN_137361 [Dreissena polymorpha]|uniref:Peptidase A2 domain-containing protein n=1 Tax=Dreissena polymorpha TaxID=45954 RepID=A0A9D4JGC7_DREPO|nr:hypothetical protein DPMN_137361 [Dreissena polymorpha]